MRPTSLASKTAEVALRTVSGYSADRCGIAAAGITYFALISIFPLALVGLSIAGFIFSGDADQQRLLDALMERLPIQEGGGREDLAGVINSIVAARGTLGIAGIISGLYTGSALFTSVRVALNGIFGGEKKRSFIVGKLIDIGMVVLFGGILVLSTGASFALTFLVRFAEDLVGSDAASVTRFAMTAAYFTIPPLVSVGFFLLLYTRIPVQAVSARRALPGAVLAALLFEVLKGGFGQYAANFGNYDKTYGSLGFVVLLLAFIYFAGQVMLLGAEAARATSEVTQGWPLAPEESRLHAVRVRIAAIRARATRMLGRRGSEASRAPSVATPPAHLAAAALPIPAPGVEPVLVIPMAAANHPAQTRSTGASAAVWATVLLMTTALVALGRRHSNHR